MAEMEGRAREKRRDVLEILDGLFVEQEWQKKRRRKKAVQKEDWKERQQQNWKHVAIL